MFSTTSSHIRRIVPFFFFALYATNMTTFSNLQQFSNLQLLHNSSVIKQMTHTLISAGPGATYSILNMFTHDITKVPPLFKKHTRAPDVKVE